MKNIIKNNNLKRILLIMLIIFIMLSTTYESYGWYSSILTRPFTNFIVQIADGINTIVTVAIQKTDYPTQVFQEAYAEGNTEEGNDSSFITAISAFFATAEDAYVSPEQIFQGDRVPITNVNIFEAEDASDNAFSTMGPEGLIMKIKGTVQQLYLFIRNISAIVMLGALIYVGIMIILTRGNPKAQSEWRQRIVFWAKGLILVMFIHVLMIAILYFSQKLTEVLSISYEGKSLLWTIKKQYAGFHMFDGTGLMIEAILYAFTSYAAWVFAIAYFKRFMYMMVMIVIAPIFGALYGTGNFGKQRFNHWLREFIAGVLVQPFHILIFYILFYMPLRLVGGGGGIVHFNNTYVEIYALIAILMIRPIEKFVRALFGLSGTALDNVASFESGKKTIDNGINAVKKVGEVAVMIGAAVATGGATLGATAGTMAKTATAQGAAGALSGGPTPKPQLPGGPNGNPKLPGGPLGGGDSPLGLDPAGGGNALQLPEGNETLDNPTGFPGDVFSTDDTNSLYGENYGQRKMDSFADEPEGDSELGDNIRNLNNKEQNIDQENKTSALGDDKRGQDGESSHIEDILQDAFNKVKNGEPLDIEDLKKRIEEGGGDPQYIDSIMSNLRSAPGAQKEETPEVEELNANNIGSLGAEEINKAPETGEKKEEITGETDQKINGQTYLNADNVENLDAESIGASSEGSDSFERVLNDALAQGENLDIDEFNSRLDALGIGEDDFRKNIEALGLDPDKIMDQLGIEAAETPKVGELNADDIGSLDSEEINKSPEGEEISGGAEQKIEGQTHSTVDNIENITAQTIGTIGVKNPSNNAGETESNNGFSGDEKTPEIGELNADNIDNLGAEEINKAPETGEKKEEITGETDQKINGQTYLNADNVENLDAESIGASSEGSDSFERVLNDALAQGENLDIDDFNSRLDALGIDGADDFRKNVEDLGLDPDEVMDKLGIEELNNNEDTTEDEDKTKNVEHVDAEYIGNYKNLDDYKTKTSGEQQSTIENDNKKTSDDKTTADNLKVDANNVLFKGDKVLSVGGVKMDMGGAPHGTTGTNGGQEPVGQDKGMTADKVLRAMGIETPKKDEKMSRVESTFRILTSPEARKKYSEAAEAMHGFTDSLYVQGGSGDSGIPRKLFNEMTEKRKQNVENRFINNQGNINAVIQAKGFKDKVDKNGVVYKTKEEQAKDFLKSAAPYADSGITDIKTIISIMNKGGAANTGDINSVLHSIVQNNTIQNKINKENRQTVEAHNSFVTNSNNINQIRENVQKRMGISQGDMSSKFIREQVDKAVSREIEKALPYITNGVVTNASRLIDVNRLGDEISKHVKVTNQAQSVNMVTRADKIIQDALKQGLKEIKLPTNTGADKVTTAQLEKILNAELSTRRAELNSSQASRQAREQARARAENTANRSNVGGNTAQGRPNTRTSGEQNQNPQQGMPSGTRRGRPRK